MLEEFALLASLFSIVIATFAIIIILLLKKNVTDILNKDVILFDKNFDIKKHAIDKSFELLDEINRAGNSIIKNGEFKSKATACYNELLCVISDIKIVDKFYSLAISGENIVDDNAVAKYKFDCRKDIGFKIKGSATLNKINSKKSKTTNLASDKNERNTTTQQQFNQLLKNEQVIKAQSMNGANLPPQQPQPNFIRPNNQPINPAQPPFVQPNVNRAQANNQATSSATRAVPNTNITVNRTANDRPTTQQAQVQSTNANTEKRRGRPRKS